MRRYFVEIVQHLGQQHKDTAPITGPSMVPPPNNTASRKNTELKN